MDTRGRPYPVFLHIPINETPMTTYTSSLGRAIAILRAGNRLPPSLAQDLRDLGYDIPSLHQAHLNQKA